MYNNRRSIIKKEGSKRSDNIHKLVRFAEGRVIRVESEQEKQEIADRLKEEKIELNCYKMKHKINTQNKKRKPQSPQTKNKKLPVVPASQPTMTQCLRNMESNQYEDTGYANFPCSQRIEYAQQEEVYDGYDNDFCPPGEGIARSEFSEFNSTPTTPVDKIQKKSVIVTDEKKGKPKIAPPTHDDSQQKMIDHQEGFENAQNDLIHYHESSINRDGEYDDLCPQCDTHSTFCYSKIFTSYCSAYALQHFHLFPMSWDRRRATHAYTKAYNRALDYILFKEKGKLNVKAKFFPPACMKHSMEESFDEIELDLQQMREEQISINTYKLLDNEKTIQNKEEIIGEIDPNLHDEEEIEKMRRDPNRCPGCLLMKHQCHNVLFGPYCKAKVIRCSDQFPSAMDRESSEELFLQKYQVALNIHIFWKFDILVSEAKYTFPKRCLLDNMLDTCDFMEQKHTVYKSSKGRKRVDITELKESSMDYHGTDPDKV